MSGAGGKFNLPYALNGWKNLEEGLAVSPNRLANILGPDNGGTYYCLGIDAFTATDCLCDLAMELVLLGCALDIFLLCTALLVCNPARFSWIISS